MRESYEKNEKKLFTRDSIIGLGEESFRKNYYPELQEKIMDLEQINGRNKALISSIPDILLVSNMTGDIRPFMESFVIKGEQISKILNDYETIKILQDGVIDVLHSDGFLTREFQLFDGEQELFYEARFQVSDNKEILIIIRDMTERILLEHKLREMTEKDGLTQLYNRRKFEEVMKQYHNQDIRNLAVLSIDVNGLKFINDTLGHLSGDRIIIAAATIISDTFSPYGCVSRIGGDEFGVIIKDIEIEQIESLLTLMVKKATEYNLSDKTKGLSLAYGYSYHNNGIALMELMFQEADNNMYQNKLLKKESIRNTFVKTFLTALEHKNYYSEKQAASFEKLATQMGIEIGLSEEKMDSLILLTRFHNIGLVGIPDSILKKDGPLNEIEWKVMKTHPSIGERIALEASEIRQIAPMILNHHEAWDGSGYPIGLSGEDIPIECRIFTIIDSFYAMISDRPYRMAMTKKNALSEIKSASGKKYSPRLVSVFLRIIKEEGQ